MGWRGSILLLCLTAAGSSLAQSDERPEFVPAEPERRPPPQTFDLGAVTYPEAQEGWDRFSSALDELVRFVRTSTDLAVGLQHRELDLVGTPRAQAVLLFLAGIVAVLRFGPLEKEALGAYLRGGGLLFGDDVRPSRRRWSRISRPGLAGTPFDRQFKALMKDPLVLGSQGSRWQRIPPDHPVYSSYYDFPDGPPVSGATGGPVDYLEMLEVRGRVAVIFSDLNLSLLWSDTSTSGRERGLQLGVNLIVFAIAQRIGGGLVIPRPPRSE